MNGEVLRNPKWYYYPLDWQDHRFVESDEAKYMSLDLPIVPSLEGFLTQHYTLANHEVELKGHTYFTSVYVPTRKEDLAYVIANEEGIPQDAMRTPVVKHDSVRLYLLKLTSSLAYSESISPSQSSYLETEFMTPAFAVIDPSTGKMIAECSWNEFLHKSHVILVGEPGAGKTTSLRRLCTDITERNTRESITQRIPVYIQLRETNETDLFERIRHQLTRLGAEVLADDLNTVLHFGRLMIVLDGLDELPAVPRYKLIKTIEEFRARYPKAGVIVSTRKAGYEWQIPGFIYLEMKPFSPSKILEWCRHRLYLHGTESWPEFVSHLVEQPDILEIVSNPLMLTITEYLYRSNSVVPKNRATLLSKFVDALVETWDLVRGISRSSERWAASDYKLAYLCRAAYYAQKSGGGKFTLDDFFFWAQDLADRSVTESMLPLLESATGLCRRTTIDDREGWEFTHKVIQDYLAAKYLIERTDDVADTLQNLLADQLWEGIWVDACGLAQESSYLLAIVCESSAIPQPRKTRMLLRALSQNLRAKSSVIEAACHVIVQTVEDVFGHAKLKHTNIGPSSDIIWHTIIHLRNDEDELTDPSYAIMLLQSVYAARYGSARSTILEMLQSSNSEVARRVAESFDYDGYFDATYDRHHSELTAQIAKAPE